MLRWLHISDLHFNDNDMSTVFLREELPAFLKRNNMYCDYIFCTGDIRTANANPNIFPDEAVQYIKDLCSAVGITTDRLFIVPGNHDVDRNVSGRDEAVRRICFHRDGYYDPKYGIIDGNDLKMLKAGQEDFNEFLAKIYTADRMEKYMDPLHPHFNIETPDFNILHVDSTITYTKDQEASDLIIGTKLLQDVLTTINLEKPTILLSHYPYMSLLQEERKYVNELLYRKNVHIWLAGHEHDHMVQPIGYFDSIQAGELRMEERTNATFLLGEFDERTNTGYVTAYTWFAEGWAKYPILWHDGRKEDRYPFQQRLLGNACNSRSREAVLAEQANLEYVNRINVIETILPVIGGIEEENLDAVLTSVWNTDSPHVILLADGGMGKTTMLLHLCKNSNKVVLYIPAERLATIGMNIKKYCARILFDGDEAAFEGYCGVKYSSPSLILLVDGLNEIDGEKERCFINEIISLNLLKGVQFVISSRSDFTVRYSMTGYQVGSLIPLKDEQIKTVFSIEEWTGILDTFMLHKLLSNPMMVTMYKEISPIMRRFENEESLEWILPIKNATDLLYDYYVAQIAVLLERNGVNGQKAQEAYQIVFEVLPELAYSFESCGSLNKENGKCRVLLQEVIQKHHAEEEKLFPLQEKFRDYNLPKLKYGQVLDFLTIETHLLYRDNIVTTFPHQIYRDFMSAFWISKQTDIEKYWNQRELPFPIMEHIRKLSGRYWSGLAVQIHEAGKKRNDAVCLVSNLLKCFPYSEIGGCPDYSDLDLCGLQIPDVTEEIKERIPMNRAIIDNISIGKSSIKPELYTHLCFSEDNKFLAAFSEGKILVFSLQTLQSPFVYFVGERITRLAFSGFYLFAVTNGVDEGIHVFRLENMWTYIGKIRSSAHRYERIFNNNFRSAILKEDLLYFYYNNREIQFSLIECRKIVDRRKQHAWKLPVDGIDVTDLKNRERWKNNLNTGILCQKENNGFIARSMLDGSLIVMKNKEIYCILEKGITLLKDGAISGNGKQAATLSYELKNGQHKIQIWNLDQKMRIGDIFCPEDVEKIHLSEDGSFVFGETKTKTWVYDTEKENVKWFHEHFISNQRGKIATYGNKVLRKNMKNDLYLFDLKTGEISSIEQPCKNARLACFMSDGSIAAVRKDGHKVKFKNIRTGTYSEVNKQNAAIVGISSFKEEPFIAVATKDNVISIYHIGDCGRKKIFNQTGGNYKMVVSPDNTVIACSNGRKSLQTFNYYEKIVNGKKRGWWYTNPYSYEDPALNGDILDIAFNTENHELVVILSSGRIMFCHEKYCRFHGKTEIITNFNVDAYDFRGCICDDLVREQIRQNGGLIDS